ncbi:hypothetical protein, partial [Brevibacterium sp. FME17]|uniref:hypothetical protein n=1 Tax=Brevibacterium sp. FME17 TaxID=2742606 RepID=UPI00186958B5
MRTPTGLVARDSAGRRIADLVGPIAISGFRNIGAQLTLIIRLICLILIVELIRFAHGYGWERFELLRQGVAGEVEVGVF